MPHTLTAPEIGALLAKATKGPWTHDGPPTNKIIWSSAENRVCFMAHSNGLDDDRDEATAALVSAAPTLARELIDALAEVERRGEIIGALEATVEDLNTQIADLTRVVQGMPARAALGGKPNA